MRYVNYIYILSVAVAALVFGGCVGGRSTEHLENEVVILEKQLGEADRAFAELIAERERLEGDVDKMGYLTEEAARLLEEKKRLEEELALARIELERGEVRVIAGDTTEKVRRTDVDVTSGEITTTHGPRDSWLDADLPFTPSTEKLHIVSKGECLSKIAGYDRYYNDGSFWPYIYINNANDIKDPHWIFEGLQLLIPLE